MKTKIERAKAIIASKRTCFTEAAIETLAALPDAELKALEDHVEKPEETPTPVVAEETPVPETPKVAEEELTEEKVLSKFPSIKAIVDKDRAASAKRKTELVGLITASAGKDVYTKTELDGKSVEELEKIAKMAVASAPVDQSGRGAPRFDTAPGDRPKVPSIDEKRREMRARGTKSA